LYTAGLGKRGQNSDRTGQLRPFSEVAAVSIGILLYWRQLPQHPDWLWCLTMVRGALLLQVNDPAISYARPEEVFTQKSKTQKGNSLLTRRKPTKPFAHKLSQLDTLSTHQQN